MQTQTEPRKTARFLHPVDCRSFRVRFRLLAGSKELLAAIPALLPFSTEMAAANLDDLQTFTLLPPEDGRGYRCLVGADLTHEDPESGPVLEQFGRDLMVHVANFAPDRVFLHAGVVGWGGGALVLPGTSFAGKTTLVAALVRAGATYYSDEYAVIDPEGNVHPYARDLQMRDPGSAEQRSLAVTQLGGCAGSSPLRVSQIVFARYERGATWNPQPVTHGMALLEMLRHAIPVQRTPARVMATLAAMLEGATSWRSARGEADAAARWLLQSLSWSSTQRAGLATGPHEG